MAFEKVKFIFHIGWPKTGTSAIQHFCFKNREKIAKLYQILYPKTGKMHFEHHYFVVALTSKQNINRVVYNFYKDHKEMFADLTDEMNSVRKDDIKKILISSEFMCGPSFVKELSEIKKKINEFKINIDKLIAYVRRQDLLLDSHYRQHMKEIWFFSDFISFARKNMCLVDFFNILNTWATVVDKSNFLIRVYDRKLFPEGNIILDFLQLLGIEMSEARNFKADINPSLSHLSALAFRKFKFKYDFTKDEHPKLLKFLFDIDRREGSFLKTFLSLEERIELLREFKESNDLLFKEYFNSSKNLFAISEEEIVFYKKQDKIEKERIDEAIENRFKELERYYFKITKRPSRREFIYFIEKFDEKTISGWIIDLIDPPAKLILKVNDISICEFETNHPRKDVLNAFPDLGYLNCGFELNLLNINLPKSILKLGNDRRIKLSLVHKRSNIELRNVEINSNSLKELLKIRVV
ncbi:hypothetical protein [Thermosulfurimonas dismutans]|uniref:Sulfotransferase domain-containing protein n=1 Tax=Thermosulfurimonas dismutans TaxID=999894 RepID=A0A179D1K8_9BACT|nr:hypothetical protein [Thermosulfurimonas dismutans]OAQ19873.1 hypothetical protein TDIS_2053 [Thermosulfurimonas dismutans]